MVPPLLHKAFHRAGIVPTVAHRILATFAKNAEQKNRRALREKAGIPPDMLDAAKHQESSLKDRMLVWKKVLSVLLIVQMVLHKEPKTAITA